MESENLPTFSPLINVPLLLVSSKNTNSPVLVFCWKKRSVYYLVTHRNIKKLIRDIDMQVSERRLTEKYHLEESQNKG